MKGSILSSIAKTKFQLQHFVKRSRNNYFGQMASNARNVKFRKVCDMQAIQNRKIEEFRFRSANASAMRQQLSTASKNSREKMMSQRINSANEVRARSRSKIYGMNNASIYM